MSRSSRLRKFISTEATYQDPVDEISEPHMTYVEDFRMRWKSWLNLRMRWKIFVVANSKDKCAMCETQWLGCTTYNAEAVCDPDESSLATLQTEKNDMVSRFFS